MEIGQFDYNLPKERISQFPARRRDSSRLMVLHRKKGTIEHRSFRNILEFIGEGDLLVLNDTKVVPVKLIGRKPTGGKVEVLLVKPLDADGGCRPPLFAEGEDIGPLWECLVDGKRVRDGSLIDFGRGLTGKILGCSAPGRWRISLQYQGNLLEVLERRGHMPLPPYVNRTGGSTERRVDRRRYQTLFARCPGSVAAPTAGLHFTGSLIRKLKEKGVRIVYITLQVGPGTFMPVRSQRVEDHVMEQEYFQVSKETSDTINMVRDRGGRLAAVGTTTVRALETASSSKGKIKPYRGYTGLFIYPGYSFKAVDALITNFHLPRSTLLMLVSAFAGIEFIKKAYRVALENGYRFYSYGDAMLII